MNEVIVNADGTVTVVGDAGSVGGILAELVEANTIPEERDIYGVVTKEAVVPAADTLAVEVDIDAVDLRTHKWLKSRYDAEEWAALRVKRDELLAASDWVVVKAQEAGEDVPSAWVTYRTALRNLPAATSDPANPTWPTAP